MRPPHGTDGLASILVASIFRSREMAVRIAASSALSVGAVLCLATSASPMWLGISSWFWRHNFELIWFIESAILLIAGVIAFFAPGPATSLAIPALLFRAISVFQFVVPKSGFDHHAPGTYWIAVVGWVISLLAVVALLMICRPYWGFGRGALLVAVGVFAIAIVWSVMASLPWSSFTETAGSGQTFNANHKSVLVQTCCTTWDRSNPGGAAGVLWFQAAAPPVFALVLGLRRFSLRRGLGFISLGLLMFSIPLTVYTSLLPRSTHHASNGFSFAVVDSPTWETHAMAISAIAIMLVGVGASLWTAASRVQPENSLGAASASS